ncbi:MAG: hypothetical protein U1A16_00025 [Patescibacteria group bacterium]|nr:hypothetical protein [Patescibacteria group bacterium]
MHPVHAPHSFEEAMEEPEKMMAAVAAPLRVLIVDDRADEIAGMAEILRRWPKISLHTVIPKPGLVEVPELPPADIVLLDGAMGLINDVRVWRALGEEKFAGVVASISSGGKPTFTDWWFADKSEIPDSPAAKVAFILFMNRLIAEQAKKRSA